MSVKLVIEREGYIKLHECNFYKILDISRQLFACFKGISLATLDQRYTSSVSESWLSDEDLYTITIEPIILEQYLALEFAEDQMWEVVGNNIGFPINHILVDN